MLFIFYYVKTQKWRTECPAHECHSFAFVISVPKKGTFSASFSILHGFQMCPGGCGWWMHVSCNIVVRRLVRRALGQDCFVARLVIWSLTQWSTWQLWRSSFGEWTGTVTHACSWKPVWLAWAWMGFGDCKALTSTVSSYLHSAPIQIPQTVCPGSFLALDFLNFHIKLRKYKMVFLLYILIAFLVPEHSPIFNSSFRYTYKKIGLLSILNHQGQGQYSLQKMSSISSNRVRQMWLKTAWRLCGSLWLTFSSHLCPYLDAGFLNRQQDALCSVQGETGVVFL